MPEEALRENFLRNAFALLPAAHRPRSGMAVPAPRESGRLTAREREVAALIAQGRSNREIAETLVTSERTIESHVRNILGKLGVTSRSQIAVWITENPG